MRRPPTLVLLDVRMPILDGVGFVRELKWRGCPIPPIIVISGFSHPSDADAEIPADSWIAKPPKLDELLPTIAQPCAFA